MLLNKTDDKKLINSSNNDNRSTLHIAAITNNVRLCKLLIAKGAKNNTPMKHKVFEGLYMYSVITLGSRNMMFEFHNCARKLLFSFGLLCAVNLVELRNCNARQHDDC